MAEALDREKKLLESLYVNENVLVTDEVKEVLEENPVGLTLNGMFAKSFLQISKASLVSPVLPEVVDDSKSKSNALVNSMFTKAFVETSKASPVLPPVVDDSKKVNNAEVNRMFARLF